MLHPLPGGGLADDDLGMEAGGAPPEVAGSVLAGNPAGAGAGAALKPARLGAERGDLALPRAWADPGRP